MGCFSPNSWRLLVTGVIFFPLPLLLLLLPSSWSALRKSQQPLSGEDEPLRTHGGMWSWTEISASRWPSRSSSIRAHMPDALCVYVPFSQSVYFANSGGTNGEKKPWKLPTFSAQRARHSEQHGPDKHQTSRRLHLPLRPAASSPCSKLHRSFTFPTEELAVVSRIVFSFFFFFLLAALQLLFASQSQWLPPWNLCLSVVERDSGRAGAEARSREGLSGEWQVDSARLHHCLCCYSVQTPHCKETCYTAT